MTRREAFTALGVGTFVTTTSAQQPEPPLSLLAPYQATVGPSAAALPSSGVVRGVVLKAISPGHTIYIGTNNTLTAANGWPIADNDSVAFDISEASQIWVVASAADQRIAILPYR